MSENLIDVQLRSPSGSIQTLRVVEVLSIDGKPFLPNKEEDLQSCFQAIRHLEGRLEANESMTHTIMQSLLPKPLTPLDTIGA